MFDDSCFSHEVTDFRKLRTGHARLKVVVAEEKRRILFIARILQNRPGTTGKIRFDNNQDFYISSSTVGNQKVSLFLWTEELEFRWAWQNQIDRIHQGLEAATPEDVIVFGGFVAEESGRPHFWDHPSAFLLAKQEIVKRLPELGLVQVQQLAGMLCTRSERIAA
jgi:hypothetical protein